MKKIAFLFVCAMMLTTGFSAKADGVVDKIFLYIPNRIIDAFDMFTLNVGVGPVARLEFKATHACQFGAGIGATAKLIKDYNRQYGAGLQNGWNMAFLCMGAEDTERTNTTRLVKEYWEHYDGFCSPEQRIYDIYEGARDYWEVGGAVGLGLEVEFYLHPIDIADFVTGIFFIDLKGDDLTFESFE
ncbi:MAG: hypothetical protein GY750_12425 [Lentisphaerae bacterium]|nr:hypothetical protein [Lentisphaerota bacterium]MCP4102218.1 hypothetical protein [Lentisphaerota bacterium]